MIQTRPEWEEKIDKLLAEMTLYEKVGQLNQRGPSIYGGTAQAGEDLLRKGFYGSFLGYHDVKWMNHLQKVAVEESRLGIPLLFANDIIHGYKTIFPIPLAEACSFEPELAEKSAAIAAREARADGTHWTFAPMVDLARDKRWGRIAEGAGEDPYLGSCMAAARVKGFQGDDLARPDKVVACAKHFAAYGAPFGGRDYNNVEMSPQLFHDMYLPPFCAAVDAGVGTVMSAFHSYNGVPCTVSKYLLTDILREELGFAGVVVSDWNSVGESVVHGYSQDGADAAKKSLEAGLDIDMDSQNFSLHLERLVEEGVVSEEKVDNAVRRVLRLKFALGLFDNPYTDETLCDKVMLCDEHLQAAREAVRRSTVLLKNDGVLPLQKNVAKLAVIGPMADAKADMLGTWAAFGDGNTACSLLEGIKAAVSAGTEVIYDPACEAATECEPNVVAYALDEGVPTLDESGIAPAVAKAAAADVIIAALGEPSRMSGEGRCRTSLDLPGVQKKLLEQLVATGKPVVLVLFNGRPLTIGWEKKHVNAIVEAWHGGLMTGHGVADILFGDYNPSAKLCTSFPNAVGEEPTYYNHTATGRPAAPEVIHNCRYMDVPLKPVYPFGYGLSYSTFAYSSLTIEVKEDAICASAVVENTSQRFGEEVVQLYVRDLVGSVVRPVKELKGFQKIGLAPGEKKTVCFTLDKQSLGFYNQQMQYVVEPGDFRLWIGPDSATGLEGGFTL